jgi:hypothetical protein
MRKSDPDDYLEELEKSLEAALKPVSPRPEYKAYLHERLVDPPQELEVEIRKPSPGYIILAAVGLTGSVILLITAIKALTMYADAGRRQLHPRSYA